MSVDILGTSCDQYRSMVQYSFTSTETRRLVRTDSPGRPPRISHSSWTMLWRWGKREIIYLSLHCHYQNDSCIEMGSDESHFNVSVGSDGQSNNYLILPVWLRMILVMQCLWYSPRHCEIVVLSASHAHNLSAWLLIILSQLPSCIIVTYR